MLSCHQATRIVSEAQERPLTFREKVSLKIHVMICSGCRNFESSMSMLRKSMQEFARGNYESPDSEYPDIGSRNKKDRDK